MGRDECFLHRLAEEEIKGLRVINSASALLSSTRSVLTRLFEEKKIPTPESRTLTLAQLREYASHPISSGCFSSGSLWIKRGDACAQQATDVCFIRNKEELQTTIFKAKSFYASYLLSVCSVKSVKKHDKCNYGKTY